MADQLDSGFIFLHRRILAHAVWRQDVWVSRVWHWLLLTATHRGNMDHRGLRPGVLQCTVRDIQDGVWYEDQHGRKQMPGRDKVNRVFLWLTEQDMIRYRKDQGVGVRVEIVNWVLWQHTQDNYISPNIVAFNDDGEEGWEPDPAYRADHMMELWGRSNLPNSPHWSVQELALHNLHHQPPHFTADQIRLIVNTVKTHAGDALSWIWKAGPVRLTRPIKSTGQLTAEFVLHFEPLEETKHGKRQSGRRTNSTRRSRVERGFDELDKALGWESTQRREVTGEQLPTLPRSDEETRQ